jgi:alkylation response protein AidB-like acyl-CoA dehydrogenase
MENLPQERLSIAVAAVAAAESVLETTIEYCKTRKAFGRNLGAFQNTRFVLAELATEVEIARHYVDKCIRALNAKELTPVDAAKAKWWTTELQQKVIDRCLQLHGGYGYMVEYPVAKAWMDSRVQTIYGGTTEIMKEIAARRAGTAPHPAAPPHTGQRRRLKPLPRRAGRKRFRGAGSRRRWRWTAAD